MGVWRSGSASALHAEGLGFDPLVVHSFCSLVTMQLSFCSLNRDHSISQVVLTKAAGWCELAEGPANPTLQEGSTDV